MSELTAFNAYCRANGINANGQLATEDLAPAFSAGYKARQDALRQRVAELEEMYELSADVASTTLACNAELTAERDALMKQRDELLAALEYAATRLDDPVDTRLIGEAIASVKEKA